ncbi:MAG: SMC-Scp complex subunit ScpB [Verrucomicrobia bacterium]|nr:SMC-Scp complex subunit ScpB [Verrucomicrobiota bacterium]
MEFNLKKVLKAMLASTSEPLSIKDIQAVITRYHEQREKQPAGTQDDENADEAGTPEQALIQDIINQVPTLLTATQIREAVAELNQEMADSGDVTRILQGPEGFRMTIAPDYAEWIRLLRNDPRPQKLTQAALETLAIVAYRQPVTRGEMESIRGVSVDSAISKLLDLELIAVSGKADLPGRPSQFSTTPKFLDFVGLQTISELPESDVLSPAQISAWIERAKNPTKATAADVGLPDESVPAKQTEIPLDDVPAAE